MNFLKCLVISLVMLSCSGGGGGYDPPTYGAFRVVNNTNRSVYHLYLTPVSSITWGNDQLGSAVIPVDGSFTLTGVPGGYYDSMVVFSSGYQFIYPSFYVFNGSTYTLTLTGNAGVTNPNGPEIATNKQPDPQSSTIDTDSTPLIPHVSYGEGTTGTPFVINTVGKNKEFK